MTGRGTSRTDVTRARDLAPTAFRRRNSSGMLQLSLNRDGGACMFLRAVHGAAGKRGEGGSRRLRNTERCALTASRKYGPSTPAVFSLAPQLLFQSNANRRCADPRTGRSQLSAFRGSNSRIEGVGSYPSRQQGRIN